MPRCYHNIWSWTYSVATECQVYSAADVTRFWAKVQRGGAEACWLWAPTKSKQGPSRHAQFIAGLGTSQRRTVYAHRVAWALAHGPIPDGLVVCHHCDTPRCVNVAHLFLGTQADNLQDARNKGRLDESLPRPGALTFADRVAIYLTPRDTQTIALVRRYGVTRQAINQLRRGRFAGAPVHRPEDAGHLALEPVAFVRVPVRGTLSRGSILFDESFLMTRNDVSHGNESLRASTASAPLNCVQRGQ